MKNETNKSEKKTWKEPMVTDNGVTVRFLMMAALGGALAAIGGAMVMNANAQAAAGEEYHTQFAHLPAIEEIQSEELPESFQDGFSLES